MSLLRWSDGDNRSILIGCLGRVSEWGGCVMLLSLVFIWFDCINFFFMFSLFIVFCLIFSVYGRFGELIWFFFLYWVE